MFDPVCRNNSKKNIFKISGENSTQYKRKMKNILKKQWIILSLLSVIELGMSGCQEDFSDPIDLSGQLELCAVKQIAFEELPDGVEPLILTSVEELELLVEQMNNLEEVSESLLVSCKGAEVVTPNAINLGLVRLKSSGVESGIIDRESKNVGGISVLIHLAYEHVGGAITVTSTESSSSWIRSWNQTAGMASFINGNTAIQYSVRGDVITYALIETSLFEVSRTNYKIEGNFKLSSL